MSLPPCPWCCGSRVASSSSVTGWGCLSCGAELGLQLERSAEDLARHGLEVVPGQILGEEQAPDGEGYEGLPSLL